MYRPTPSPTTAPTPAPTTDPTRTPTVPTTDPTFDPTTEPTPYPIKSSKIIKYLVLSLDATFEDLVNANIDMFDWAKNIIKFIINITNYPMLSDHVDINIVHVRQGNIIIDYKLIGDNEYLLELALNNINTFNSTQFINIDNITFSIISNNVLECNPYLLGINDSYYPFDSYNTISNVSILPKINDLDQIYSVSNQTVFKETNGEDTDCNGGTDTVSTCFIQCIGYRYCRRTKIIPSSTDLNELIIICDGDPSCQYMQVNIDDNTQKVRNVTLSCFGALSCDSSTIDITAENDMKIDIHCDDKGGLSCQGMVINLNNNNNTLGVTITCYKESSCDGLFIDGNNATNMSLKMIMYEDSNNVEIIYRKYKEIEFICINPPNQPHFLQFDIHDIKNKDESQIKQLAQDEYNSGTFPCDGIVIGCPGNNRDVKCTMNYNGIQENIYQIQTDIDASDDVCYWVDIAELFTANIECPDSCFDETETIVDKKEWWQNGYAITIGGSILVLIIIGLIIYFKFCRNKGQIDPPLNVKNPMVILLAIGDYEERPKEPELEGICRDLDGVDLDIKNLLRLFGRLNYDCYPKYEDPEFPTIEWTKSDLIIFLKKQATVFQIMLLIQKIQKMVECLMDYFLLYPVMELIITLLPLIIN